MLLESNFEHPFASAVLPDRLRQVRSSSVDCRSSQVAVLPEVQPSGVDRSGQIVAKNHVDTTFLTPDGHDNLSVDLYTFLRSILRVSGRNAGSIDKQIEQAMDLVKSHLLSAVRDELEGLREKISHLEEVISSLQTENDILRTYASPEVLEQLQQNRALENQQQQ